MNEEEKAIEFLKNKTTNYSLSEEELHYYLILYYLIINLQKEIHQLKEQLETSEKARKESMLILGKYRHYTLPTEEQNRENEDIVDKAYNNLILKQDIYIYIKENKDNYCFCLVYREKVSD